MDENRIKSPVPPAMNRLTGASHPPTVQVALSKGHANASVAALFLGAITDWIGVGVMAWLLYSGKVTEAVAVPVIVGLCSGTIVGKMRSGGTGGGSTTAALVATLGKPALLALLHLKGGGHG